MISPGWVEEPLANVAHIERDAIAPDRIQPGTRYIGLEHIDGEGRISTPQVVENGEIESTKFAFSNRHILYGKLRPYLRKIALPDFEGVCSTDILPIFPKNGKMDRRFLYHYLRQQHLIELATTRSTGANLPRLSPRILAEFPVTYPRDTAEQRRIAAILDKADAIRRKHEQALALADDFLRSTFLHMFGDPVTNPKRWKTRSCDKLCSRITVGIVVRPASYYQPSGVPALRSLNIETGSISKSNLVYFSQKDNETRLSKTRVWENDIVVVRSGQPGKAAIIPKDLDGVNAIDILIMTPRTDAVEPKYLCDFLNSAGGRQFVIQSERGQIQKHLNVGAISASSILLPPLELQQRYKHVASKVGRFVEQQKSHLTDAHNLFASLSQRAFRGEL